MRTGVDVGLERLPVEGDGASVVGASALLGREMCAKTFSKLAEWKCGEGTTSSLSSPQLGVIDNYISVYIFYIILLLKFYVYRSSNRIHT